MKGILSILLGAAALAPAIIFILLIFTLKAATGKGKKALLAAVDLSVFLFFFSVYIKMITIWELPALIYLYWSFIGWFLVFILFFALAKWKRPWKALKKMWRLSFLVYFSASFILLIYGAGLYILNELY
ncbi:DUF3397 family protein [Metabacillus sp. KIGAM252]|uniref:DUF3397 family protein n=1 Tax=Metabacillus flavus TaxID=2823519 RepID=A0ABS5LEC3_9BACI|nr:DUF3397 family protein [Metabacillus flavus]MBS2968868.1 DUF3397 family protein [Metabacillus flavus]